jgi:uncharacterized membrane protein YeaQ/YmgE (transglycosylase-associated protein family)
MNSGKSTLWIIIGILGTLGGYLPTLIWNTDPFGPEGIIGGFVGSVLGIWIWYKYFR